MILPTRFVEKPWGVETPPPPFRPASDGAKIGEVWFEPPPELDTLLVKYIFTGEALSVQVHPSDDQTLAAGEGRQGKEECWLIINAEPGAVLGIGFDESLSADRMRATAQDGSIEHILTWHPVQAGDFFYIPANTVHAIGAGISLIEVQQNSDITYRLFDYGRPRELHLDRGMAVASGEPYDPALRRHLPERGAVSLVDGPYFRLDRLDGPAEPALAARYAGNPLLVMPRSGAVEIGGQAVRAGQCALAPSLDEIAIAADTLLLIAQSCSESESVPDPEPPED